MKILAFGLLGLGWFAHALHSSEGTVSTTDWLKHSVASLQSELEPNYGTNDNLAPTLKSAYRQSAPRSQHISALTEDHIDSSASSGAQEALKWIVEKSEENLSTARASLNSMTQKTNWSLPTNDPGNTSRPALEQALRTQPATAAYPLAYALEHGIGGHTDYKRAVQLYQRAAESGDARAQSRLGIAYMKGQLGLHPNFNHAEKWLTEAAILNDLNGQYYLGRLLLKDSETNLVDALIWVAVAAKRGYDPAQSVVKEYWSMLTHRQQDELLSRVRQWHVSESPMTTA